jgi:hypothetical protein
MSKRLKSDGLLFLTAFIWGSAFVAQKVGGDIGTFTYNGIRTFIGGLVLIPVILILDSMSRKKNPVDTRTARGKSSRKEAAHYRRTVLRRGFVRSFHPSAVRHQLHHRRQRQDLSPLCMR